MGRAPSSGPPPPAWRLGTPALIPALGFLAVLRLLPAGASPTIVDLPWVPSLGVQLTLHVDGLARLFLLLITGIGTAVFIYAAAYLRGTAGAGRLMAMLLVFMAAMAGAVVADNAIALFVCWELTSLVSFFLVGFKHGLPAARRAAQQALHVTLAGGLALLAGLLLLGHLVGSYSLRAIIDAGPSIASHPWLPAALACVFAGAFSKSAQWPFHFWLPNAMTAPTPVSAYLHSATMVKLGVYLLARLHPGFGHLLFWEVTLVTVGAVTAVWAMALAIRERDLKRILARSTVAALGLLVLLIGLPGPGAAEATAAFLLAHALYKAPLFFIAGNVDHSTGTRSIDRLAAMARVMPWTALAAALAAASMAGVPLSFGYVAKDLVTIAKTEGLVFEWISYATMAVSAVTIAVASVAAVRVFWHRGGDSLPDVIHEASPAMIAAPLVVAMTGIALGVAPALSEFVIADAARAMLPATDRALVGLARDDVSSAGTTALVFLLGGLIFWQWDRLHRALDRMTWLERVAFARAYDRILKLIPLTARAVTMRLQHGWLPGHVAVLVACLAGAGVAALVLPPRAAWPAWSTPPLAIVLAGLLTLFAALAACRARDPFVMVLVSGLAGAGTAVFALFLGAPDVALTQFAVEVAFVVIVAAVIRRLRDPARETAAPPAAGRAAIALVCGVAVAALTLAAAAPPFDDSLSRYFGERSLTDAFGRNVVNVILVDFRAIDTLGEILVILLALVAAWPLAQTLRRGTRPAEDRP